MQKKLEVRSGKIEAFRRKKGWTQAQLADEAGVGVGTVRNAEDGKTLHTSKAIAIAKALGVDASEITKSGDSESASAEESPEKSPNKLALTRPEGEPVGVIFSSIEIPDPAPLLERAFKLFGVSKIYRNLPDECNEELEPGDLVVIVMPEAIELEELARIHRLYDLAVEQECLVVPMFSKLWATSFHRASISSVQLKDHTPTGLDAWADELGTRLDGTRIYVNAHPPLADSIANALVALREQLDLRRDADIARHLQAVREIHGKIHLVGLPKVTDIPAAAMDLLFVEPALAERHLPVETPNEELAKLPVASEIAFATEPLVILGDPGSGKSTLLAWLAWNFADDEPNRLVTMADYRIPILLTLRDLKITQECTFESILAEFVKTPGGRWLTVHRILELMQSGRLAVLVDGFDEIGDVDSRKHVCQIFQNEFKEHSNGLWFFSARVLGYEDVPLHLAHKGAEFRMRLPSSVRSNEGGKVARRKGKPPSGDAVEEEEVYLGDLPVARVRYMAPATDARVADFARKWYELRRETAEAHQAADNLVSAIQKDVGTRTLARNAISLVLMAIIHYVRARLPHGRAELYAEMCEAFLDSIDGYRGLTESPDRWTDKQRWLSRVAFEMQLRRDGGENQQVLAAGADVRKWLTEAMAESHRGGTEADARKFLDYIKRRAGLLLERDTDTFAFAHLSIQEYLAAVYIKDQFAGPWYDEPPGNREGGQVKESVLTKKAAVSAWHEVFVLLAEILAKESPATHGELERVLFGRRVENLKEPPRHNGVNVLLARLVADSYSGLNPANRDRGARLCWQACVNRMFLAGNLIGQALLSGDGEHNDHMLRLLTAVAKEAARLDLNGCPVEDLEPLQGLTNLQHLDLNGTRVESIEPLKGLTKLQGLWLTGTRVENLEPLQMLTNLKGLFLHGTRVENLEPLQRLTNLQYLHFSDTRVENLEPLQGLTELVQLDLNDTRVENLEPLKGLTKLETLVLNGTRVENLEPLKLLTNLQLLNLNGTRVENLEPLKGLTKLERLELTGTRVENLEPLKGLTNLKALLLTGTRVENLEPLKGLTNLKALLLNGTRVKDFTPVKHVKHVYR